MLWVKFCDIRDCNRCETILQGVNVFLYEKATGEPSYTIKKMAELMFFV
jgi:hypothetical protein